MQSPKSQPKAKLIVNVNRKLVQLISAPFDFLEQKMVLIILHAHHTNEVHTGTVICCQSTQLCSNLYVNCKLNKISNSSPSASNSKISLLFSLCTYKTGFPPVTAISRDSYAQLRTTRKKEIFINRVRKQGSCFTGL